MATPSFPISTLPELPNSAFYAKKKFYIEVFKKKIKKTFFKFIIIINTRLVALMTRLILREILSLSDFTLSITAF